MAGWVTVGLGGYEAGRQPERMAKPMYYLRFVASSEIENSPRVRIGCRNHPLFPNTFHPLKAYSQGCFTFYFNILTIPYSLSGIV